MLISDGRRTIVFQLVLRYMPATGKHRLSRHERPNGFSLRVISRDPEVYPDPDEFKPQRWMSDQGRLKDGLKFIVFGFGRR